MDMPVVNSCAAEQCAYNIEQQCHALAITVGDSLQANCETYFGIAMKGGDRETPGHVGACKMQDCVHNSALECQAPGISVGMQADLPNCVTYQPAYQAASRSERRR
jgi:hypothetical protein